jgi:hypothetical protein
MRREFLRRSLSIRSIFTLVADASSVELPSTTVHDFGRRMLGTLRWYVPRPSERFCAFPTQAQARNAPTT